jgi:muramidase (phage lysozyme)
MGIFVPSVSGEIVSGFFCALRMTSKVPSFIRSFRDRNHPVFSLALCGSVLISTLPVLQARASEGPLNIPADTARVDDRSVAQLSLPRLTFPGFPAMPRYFAITPERRALLNTIRYAEGTWKEGTDLGYRVMFGGGLMPSLDRHPDRVNYTSGYASAAAGAYQFMPSTLGLVTRAMNLVGFGPQVQDQAALYLIARRGALPLADRGELNAELAALLAPEWASFPTLRGASYYGQPVRRLEELQRFYQANLVRLRNRLPLAKTADACQDGSLDCALKGLQDN